MTAPAGTQITPRSTDPPPPDAPPPDAPPADAAPTGAAPTDPASSHVPPAGVGSSGVRPAVAPAGGVSPGGPPTDISVVTCLEPGPMAASVVLMLRSLRQFGGRLADAPVYAVRPRRNVPINPQVLAALRELNVQITDVYDHPSSWYHFLNKTVAVRAVERSCPSTHILWIDHDIILAAEPSQLIDSSADLVVCDNDTKYLSASDGFASLAYWNALRQAAGVEAISLEQAGAARYFNAGIFRSRRSAGFGAAHVDAIVRAMRMRVWHRVSGLYYLEQTLFPLVAERMRLTTDVPDERTNYPILRTTTYPVPPDVTVLHYHDLLEKPEGTDFRAELVRLIPQARDWLDEYDRLAGGHSRAARALRRGLRFYWSARRAWFKRRSRVM